MNYLRILLPIVWLNLASIACSYCQPYRLAALPKRQTAQFYGLEWESLGNVLKYMGSQHALVTTYDTTGINARWEADTEGLKDFDSLLYVSQYESSYGMRFGKWVKPGKWKVLFHFINFTFEDTTRQRHIDLFTIKNDMRIKRKDINMSDFAYNKFFTFDMDLPTVEKPEYIMFELVNDFSDSVKDNYVTLTAFEMVHVDSLFSYELPLGPIELENTVYPTYKVRHIVERLGTLNSEMDSLLNVLSTLKADTITETKVF